MKNIISFLLILAIIYIAIKILKLFFILLFFMTIGWLVLYIYIKVNSANTYISSSWVHKIYKNLYEFCEVNIFSRKAYYSNRKIIYDDNDD